MCWVRRRERRRGSTRAKAAGGPCTAPAEEPKPAKRQARQPGQPEEGTPATAKLHQRRPATAAARTIARSLTLHRPRSRLRLPMSLLRSSLSRPPRPSHRARRQARLQRPPAPPAMPHRAAAKRCRATIFQTEERANVRDQVLSAGGGLSAGSAPSRVCSDSAASGSKNASAAITAASSGVGSSRSRVTSSPRSIRAASSLLRATITVIDVSISGCSDNRHVVPADGLDRRVERDLIAAHVIAGVAIMPTRSRGETDPNSWPASEACRSTVKLLPLSLSAT